MDAHRPAPASATPRFPALDPAGRAGAGFKPQHFEAIRADAGFGGFLEIHAENYMGEGGAPHAMLAALRERFPLSVHGVSMSIGGPRPLDREHLRRFVALVERYRPALVSEHLAWSTHDDIFYSDLLPLPLTQATLDRVVAHVDEVQAATGRRILIENPSSYLVFPESTWREGDFLAELSRRTGCGLLLDVNNVFVSAANLDFEPHAYLRDFPLEKVEEVHLAGHDVQADDEGDPLLIDTHDRAVADPVWRLYAFVVRVCGPLPTLVEWDSDVPDWSVLRAEIDAAGRVMRDRGSAALMGKRHARAR